MSKMSEWVYTNTATVRPFLSVDQWSHQIVYGDEYQIDCTWVAKSEQQTDADGNEFVSKYEIFTENPAPKYLDMIQLRGHSEWQEIRSKTEWDFSMFDEEPDFKLVT